MQLSIAVIGMGCIFPDAMNISEYWSNIVSGKDSIREIPDSYWLMDDYYDTDKSKSDKSYSKKAGVVNDIAFNPLEFGIMPKDLESISVDQIFALVAAKQALTDAGLYGKNAKDFDRDKTGVILAAGIGKNAFSLNVRIQIPKFRKILLNSGVSKELTEMVLKRMADAETEWTENSNPGYLPNVVAGRVAGRFNLYGTNCTVDAACASSFAALKCAVNELENGDCDIVLTGGVNLDCSEFSFVSFCKTPAISPSDHVRPFDKDSDGMILGDGVGMIVLKRLDDAQRDGDKIYGVIKGIGSSGDGRAKGIFAPSVDGQVKALQRAYKRADINPGTITMIEAHGTGTKVGDNYELEAISKLMGDYGAVNEIGIGSVKSQIGHTRLSAGIAGLIKVLLSLHHKVQPGTLHVDNPSPVIENSHIKVIRKSRPWITNKLTPVRRAGVSAFGFGGTNYHVIVEEYDGEHKKEYRMNDIPRGIVLSGNTIEILVDKCRNLRKQLASYPDTDLNEYYGEKVVPRKDHRVGFVVTSAADAISKLDIAINLLKQEEVSDRWEMNGIHYRSRGIRKSDKLAALFCQPEAVHVDMLREVVMNYPEMRESFQYADNIMIKSGESPLSQIVYPYDSETQIQFEHLNRTDTSIFLTGVIMAGLHKLFQNRGFGADFYIGYDVMEPGLLFAGGAMKEKECLKKIHKAGMELERQSSSVYRNGKDVRMNMALRGSIYDRCTGKRYPVIKSRKSEKDKQDSGKSLEDCIKYANKKGAAVFLSLGAERDLFDSVKEVLSNLQGRNAEVISMDLQPGENSMVRLESVFTQLRVLGLNIAKDKYSDISSKETEEPGKHFISVNPRIYRSEQKEKAVHEAVYGKSLRKESGASSEKSLTGPPAPKIKEDDIEDHIVTERKYTDYEEVCELLNINRDAFMQFLNSQRSDISLMAEVLKSSRGDLQKELSVKRITDSGNNKLEGFKSYIGEQNRAYFGSLHGPVTVRKEEGPAAEKETGMRLLDVSLKEADPDAGKYQLKKGLAVVMPDRGGAALHICGELKKQGYTPLIIDSGNIECDKNMYPAIRLDSLKEADIKDCFEKINETYREPLTGFIYISSDAQADGSIRDGFGIIKAVFLIAKYFYLYSDKNVQQNQKKFFMNVIRMDGKLGITGIGNDLIGAGLFGLSKSLSDEWKADTLVKTIDVQRECTPETTAGYVMEELLSGSGMYPEIGRAETGKRYFIGLKEKRDVKAAAEVPGKDDVFLVSGGGHGITAKCIARLAEKYHSKFILLGRTGLKDDINWLKNCGTKREIQDMLVARMREKNIKQKPKEISDMVNSYYAQLMIRNTMEEISRAGSQVLYYPCDITDENEVKKALKDAVPKVGAITGFIHGAGVLADKYIHDKAEKDFDLVAGTKIFGLNSCLNNVDMGNMKYIILFSSVAAFFGNKGQTDYSMANEVLNKMAYLLKYSYPSCKTIAVNWGPWDGGMIDKALKEALASRDISVIPVEKGVDLFMELFDYEQESGQAQVVVFDRMYF